MKLDQNVIYGGPFEELIEENLGQLVYVLLNNHEDSLLLVDGITGEELTGIAILKRCIRIANFLKKQGIGLGDNISVMSENRLEFCLVPIAAFFVGATFAPLNPEYTPGELTHVLNISKPKIIFTSQASIGKLVEIKKNYPFIEQLILFGSNKNSSSSIGFNTIVNDVDKDDSIEYNVPDYDPKKTVATILCSSGTTGLPKGVMCTHHNMTTFVDISRTVLHRIVEIIAEETAIATIPFFHSFGFMTMFLNILKGSKTIVFSKFNPVIFLETIVKYKIRKLLVPPPILLFILKNPNAQKYDLSCLEEIIAGAAPLSLQTQTALQKRFKIKHVDQAYGMTETTLGVILNHSNKSKLGSVGMIVPGMMAKVIDEKGNALGPNQEGELCLKGPLIMKGYVGDEDATKNCIDKDNWLHTGDVAYYDEEEFFFIVDRLKELIKYKAFQVPPAELEAILLSHPCVMDAAVIGLPDEDAGELPLAYVVKKPGKKVTETELQKFVSDKVSSQKKLRGGVRFIAEIPRNPSGKILRRVLKQQTIENMKSKL